MDFVSIALELLKHKRFETVKLVAKKQVAFFLIVLFSLNSLQARLLLLLLIFTYCTVA